MSPAAVIHLHLHQPPREDPWLGYVPREPDCAPDHDALVRAERTCYRPLVAARVTDADERVRRVVDTLARASFDVAPTLLAWLARSAPATYAAVLGADRDSQRRTGHGNAIAHPYHHVILPLLSRRDKITEVRWGLADFARHFGRPAAGMWLPECAVDDETLDVLAAEGVQFTIVAPHQVDAAPSAGRPGRYVTAAGREIAVCTFDAGIAHDVAFGPLVRDGVAWAARLRDRLRPPAATSDAAAAPRAPLVAVAATAETFGLHHRFGDMALAAMFDALEHPASGAGGVHRAGTLVLNFAAVLAAEPATDDVRVLDRTSWSCAHGLARWESECECRRDPHARQRWRAPLVAALADLRAALDARFAGEGASVFGHLPGGAEAVRNAYNDRHGDDDGTARGPGDSLALGGGYVPATADPVWARELLEMSREALAMADADGIGSDDLAAASAQQILAHAARAAALAGPHAAAVSDRLRRALSSVVGAHVASASARAILQRLAPADPPLAVRVAAGVAATAAVGAPNGTADGTPPAWRADVGAPDGDGAAGPAGAITVRVGDRRLGTGATYAVVVDVPTVSVVPGRPPRRADVDPRGVTILVRPVPGAPGERPAFADALGAALKLGDLPEPARAYVELALRRAVVQRLLEPEDRERLASGEAQLRTLAADALVRAVDALASVFRSARDTSLGPLGPNTTAPAVARVLGLADLAESAGAGPPFDAQSALYRHALALPSAARAQLAPVAWRLGFSVRGWRDLDHGQAADVTNGTAGAEH